MFGGGPGLRLMRIRGFDVHLDFSVLIILALIIFPFVQQLPATYPELSGGEVWTVALSAGVLFIGSILFHELCHAFVGILLGARVAGVRLFIFGGATFFSAKPSSEGKNFWISVSGPLANLTLFGVFTFLFNFVANGDSPSLVWALVFNYLRTVNLYLAIFNALPGYPMDGGQAVRSGLIWLTKNELLSSRIVMWLGCITGGLIALWILQDAIRTGSTFNLFFGGYICLMIITGSLNQYREVAGRIQPVNRPQTGRPTEARPPSGVAVGQVMSRPVQAFALNTSVADFLAQTASYGLNDQTWWPVLREGYLMGAVNRQLARRVPGLEQSQQTLEQIMAARRQFFAIGYSQDVSEANEMLKESRDVPVAVLGEGGLFAGFLTRENLKQSA